MEEFFDFYGDRATLEETPSGACIVREDYDENKIHIFGNYDAAADWIFRRGYRE